MLIASPMHQKLASIRARAMRAEKDADALRFAAEVSPYSPQHKLKLAQPFTCIRLTRFSFVHHVFNFSLLVPTRPVHASRTSVELTPTHPHPLPRHLDVVDARVQVENRARARRPCDQEEVKALRARAESAEASLSNAQTALQQKALELVKVQKTLSQSQARVEELQRDAADKAEEARRVFLRQVRCPCTV